MIYKILGIIGIALGESLAIYVENDSVHAYFSHTPFMTIAYKALPMITLSGIMLVGGYLIIAAIFRDIWLAAFVSIASILFVEPMIIWLLFREIPARGELIGFSLACLGLCAVVFL